ncbi:hypothetical protein [Tsukamurella spumae]|uniref:Uncharacterized protein n=1 Tax=Tsukamurella spumae TaxID=44753 RepID=A0A846X4W7_9ACTN|nr:hypothetical protein [Tsukamurella spumae]NKY18880.1 hypothetical protein [Tsukamurella spumae]
MGELIPFRPRRSKEREAPRKFDRRKALMQYYHRNRRAYEWIASELGLDETHERKLARLAMRVCDLEIRSLVVDGAEREHVLDERQRVLEWYQEVRDEDDPTTPGA